MIEENGFQVDQALYRYDDYREYEDGCRIECNTYYVIRLTLKGAWIKYGKWGKEHFVLYNSRKKYAYPTKEQAWRSFCIRKRRRVDHLEHQLKYAEKALRLSLTENPLEDGA